MKYSYNITLSSGAGTALSAVGAGWQYANIINYFPTIKNDAGHADFQKAMKAAIDVTLADLSSLKSQRSTNSTSSLEAKISCRLHEICDLTTAYALYAQRRRFHAPGQSILTVLAASDASNVLADVGDKLPAAAKIGRTLGLEEFTTTVNYVEFLRNAAILVSANHLADAAHVERALSLIGGIRRSREDSIYPIGVWAAKRDGTHPASIEALKYNSIAVECPDGGHFLYFDGAFEFSHKFISPSTTIIHWLSNSCLNDLSSGKSVKEDDAVARLISADNFFRAITTDRDLASVAAKLSSEIASWEDFKNDNLGPTTPFGIKFGARIFHGGIAIDIPDRAYVPHFSGNAPKRVYTPVAKHEDKEADTVAVTSEPVTLAEENPQTASDPSSQTPAPTRQAVTYLDVIASLRKYQSRIARPATTDGVANSDPPEAPQPVANNNLDAPGADQEDEETKKRRNIRRRRLLAQAGLGNAAPK